MWTFDLKYKKMSKQVSPSLQSFILFTNVPLRDSGKCLSNSSFRFLEDGRPSHESLTATAQNGEA